MVLAGVEIAPGSLAGPQALCLSMIAKNEAHVIRRCLDSVRPFLAAWAVVDTGSTDGTQDVIREYMSDLPGELIERDWVDFSTNRNQALELARQSGAEYALIVDADDTLESVGEPTVLPPLSGAVLALRDFFPDGGGEPDACRPKFVPLRPNMRWRGVAHERLGCSEPVVMGVLNSYRCCCRRDGAASRLGIEQKEQRYIDMLLAEVERTNGTCWTSLFVLTECAVRRSDWMQAVSFADACLAALPRSLAGERGYITRLREAATVHIDPSERRTS